MSGRKELPLLLHHVLGVTGCFFYMKACNPFKNFNLNSYEPFSLGLLLFLFCMHRHGGGDIRAFYVPRMDRRQEKLVAHAG
jgi:hypothetical protein